MEYDYYKAVKEDVRDYIKNEIDLKDYSCRQDLEDHLNEILWTHDGVTGNGSGSYTFSAYMAEEYLAHNLELLGEALGEFGYTSFSILKEGAESADVTIRCYLLGSSISEVLDEVYSDLYDDDEEDEES